MGGAPVGPAVTAPNENRLLRRESTERGGLRARGASGWRALPAPYQRGEAGDRIAEEVEGNSGCRRGRQARVTVVMVQARAASARSGRQQVASAGTVAAHYLAPFSFTLILLPVVTRRCWSSRILCFRLDELVS